jgi:hypothetical protein
MGRKKQFLVVVGILTLSGVLGSILTSAGIGVYLYMSGKIGVSLTEHIKDTASISVLFMLVAVPISLVLGLPAFYLLQRIHLLNGWVISAIGALAGWIAGLTPLGFISVLSCIGQGLVTAIISWILVYRYAL